MKKATETTPKAPQENLLGENTILTLTIKQSDIDREYKEALKHESASVTLKGFRKGKAPSALAEAAIGKDKLIDHALNHLFPGAYEAAVKAANIIPLVRPEITPKSMKEGEDWIFEAATAVAPVIVLGDYKKLIKAGSDKYAKKLAETKDAKENEDELLQSIFITMIESIKPKVAPILLQEEMNQQLELLNQQLGEHKIQLADYIKSQGRTEEQFKQDLAALSLGAIQLEFVLQEVTKDLNISVGEEDVNGWLKEQKYPEDTKLPEDLKQRLMASMQRRKTTEEILKIAREK